MIQDQASPNSSPPWQQAVLAAIRVVLVAPAGPLNIGSVARVMKNFGLTRLVLVQPQCDPFGEEAMHMAVHAKDVLAQATVVDSIPAALTNCVRAIATTARPRGFNATLELPEVLFPPIFAAERPIETALMFGPEDRGLSNEELTYAQQYLKIDTDDGYPALNLAQAVAVCCYELSRSARLNKLRTAETAPEAAAAPLPPLRNSPLSDKQTESTTGDVAITNVKTSENKVSEDKISKNIAPLNELEGYYQHLESFLLQVGYLHPHTAASRMRKFRQLLHRAAPTANEVALLRGILRQAEWALSDSKKG